QRQRVAVAASFDIVVDTLNLAAAQVRILTHQVQIPIAVGVFGVIQTERSGVQIHLANALAVVGVVTAVIGIGHIQTGVFAVARFIAFGEEVQTSLHAPQVAVESGNRAGAAAIADSGFEIIALTKDTSPHAFA